MANKLKRDISDEETQQGVTSEGGQPRSEQREAEEETYFQDINTMVTNGDDPEPEGDKGMSNLTKEEETSGGS